MKTKKLSGSDKLVIKASLNLMQSTLDPDKDLGKIENIERIKEDIRFF